MEERLFRHLKEPGLIELTKEDYEKRMGIIPKGKASKESKDGGQPVGADPAVKHEPQVSVSRPEAIKILRARGVAYSEIKTKTKVQLNALL